MHPGFPRYLTEMAHEAGYDAFMTGFVYLKLVAYLDKTRNPEKYTAIEAQRIAEQEAKEKEKEQQREPKVDADGWEISDDEDENGQVADETSNWDLDEEEEVYNYGSIRVDLANKDGKMDNVLSSITNKTALVRTAFDCFDFVQQEPITNQRNTILVKYNADTVFDTATAESLFAEYGKFIIEPNDACSSFVIFESYRDDPQNIKVNDKNFAVLPIAQYLEM